MNPRLCYVSGPWAFLTTCPIDKQWGDDWDDAPYEHNAGEPYGWREEYRERGIEPYEITRVSWIGELETPADIAGLNSSYSVQQINAGAVAWLTTARWSTVPQVVIPAGTTLDDFIRLVERAGGEVYGRLGKKP